MEPKKPDENDKLAWLGAAMSQNQTDGVVAVAHLFALFYGQLVADGMTDESAMMLTEAFMIWQLERAAEKADQ